MSVPTKKEGGYSTRDLGIAATLVTLGFPMAGVDYQMEGQNPRMVGYFSFDDTPELRKVESDYLLGSLRVEPKMLLASVRSLKGLVTSTYKSPKY